MSLFHRRSTTPRKPTREAAHRARSAAPAHEATDPVTATVQRILALGLDGRGPLRGAKAAAAKALAAADGDTERAIAKLSRAGLRNSAAGGFVTSLGGFAVMPVAVPANVVEFYVNAARTVGAIATLRGYDIDDPAVRTAVLLTLIGSRSTDVLRTVGVVTGGHAATATIARGLPASGQMLINKAIGFQLLKGLGERSLWPSLCSAAWSVVRLTP